MKGKSLFLGWKFIFLCVVKKLTFHILNKDINKELWCKLFSSNFRCTIESKLRSFQYQILLRSLPTKKSLKEWKIKNSDLCFYCNLETKTIEHLFWICPIINTTWKVLLINWSLLLILKTMLIQQIFCWDVVIVPKIF